MSYCITAVTYASIQVMIAITGTVCVTEGAPVVVIMVSIAVTPIPIMCPTVVYIPPTRVVSPIPRTMPCIPCVRPEPIVYNRSVNIYRLYDIVGTIYILIADYLNGYFVLLIFLYIDRGYVLEYILCEDSLQHDQTFIAFTRLYYA